MRRPPLEIHLPGGPGADILDLLRAQPRRPLRIRVPQDWCYRTHWPAPAGGWRRKLREALRPSLWPEPLEEIHWDEEVEAGGVWSLWGLSRARLDRALRPWAEAIWAPSRPVRVVPEGAGESAALSAFPNLAPLSHRRRRLPVRALLKAGMVLVPVLFLAAGALAWGRLVQPRAKALHDARRQAEATLLQGQRALQADRQILQRLQALHTGQGAQPPWVADLDALTRLLPEDTHLVALQWKPEGLRIDLITPSPELIRGILEDSPDFKEVRFQGNLERRGERSRLTLTLAPEPRR